MRTLEIADADVMRLAIQQEIARSDESRYGQRCQQVAELFGKTGGRCSDG